jgi:hypothetical protein
VQFDPIKPTLEPTGTKRLKLKCNVLLSTSACKLNLRRYTKKRVRKEPKAGASDVDLVGLT